MENSNNIVYERPIDKKVSRISTILIVVLFCITAIILGMFALGPYDAELEGPEYTPTLLNWAYVLLGISIVGAIVFPIAALVAKPKQAVKSLLIVVAFLVVAGICYALASGEVLDMPAYTGTENNPSTLKWVEGILYLMYVLIVGDIVAIIFTEIYNKIKR